MSLKICLVSPTSVGKGRVIANGIRILAGIAMKRDSSTKIKVYDGNFHTNSELEEKIKTFNPDLLGVSVFTDNYEESKRILKLIDSPIKIAGGPFATNLSHELLEYCDYVFLGEAETSFSKFLEMIDEGVNKKKLSSINGIAYKSEGIIQENKPSYEFIDLNSITSSSWKFVENYLGSIEEASPMWHLNSSMINILSSRGCNNNCIFCLSSKMHGKKPRFRNIENVEEEIKLIDYLRKKQGLPKLESVMLDDSDIFFRDKHSLENLFLMFKKYKLTYSTFASINNVDENLLKLGSETGLKTLFFGIETNEKNRGYISSGKYFNDDQARYILEKCRTNGIFTCTAFIIGFPWESYDDIQKTIECMDVLPSDYPGIGILNLHPGTAVWQYKENHKNLYSNDDSPNPNISWFELNDFVKSAYKKAYSNPTRINRLFSLSNPFDKNKALQTIERKRAIVFN